MFESGQIVRVFLRSTTSDRDSVWVHGIVDSRHQYHAGGDYYLVLVETGRRASEVIRVASNYVKKVS